MIIVGRAVAMTVVLGVAMLVAPCAAAHVRSTEGASVIRQVGSTVRVETRLEYDLLVAAAGLTPAPDDRARAEQLDRQRDRLAAYLVDRFVVSVDGVRCPGELTDATVDRRDGQTYAVARLRHACPGGASGGFRVDYTVFSDTDAVVDSHTNVADYQLGGTAGTYVFDDAHRRLDVGRTTVLAAAARFVAMGVEHILAGLDHVLFLVVLLLGSRRVVSVVKVATTFTVAHSVTLVLGILGWVDVPSEIVEPLIALSIAAVALDTILGGESRHRLPVVFAFGLLHGLGFASTLSFTDGLSARLVGSLVSFNLGIELGQALLVVVLFPVLLVIRRFPWSALAHTVAAAGAAVVGMAWFVDRVLG